MKKEAKAHWQARPEAGSSAGLKILLFIARLCGRRVLHLILVPVTGYFYLTRRPERHASADFLTKATGRDVGRRDVYRHMLTFARATADRFFFIVDQADDIPITFEAHEGVVELAESGRSGIFLAAHLGSFEAARIIGPQLRGLNLRIVLEKAVNQRLVSLLEDLQPDLFNSIIDASQDSVALGLAIGEALKGGDWVGFLADRHRVGDRTMNANFLGSPAPFPTGPYLIANLFNAPIIGAFCHFDGQQYVVHLEIISKGVSLARKTRQADLAKLVSHYSSRLEHHVLASPMAWFNFYDFWQPPQRPSDQARGK
ncbi:MAG: hypothetical protein NXH85_05190 [Pseudomonadaceae bacterium]|nr:hypothetical protein [Pseudomonadaceae bacterium]